MIRSLLALTLCATAAHATPQTPQPLDAVLERAQLVARVRVAAQRTLPAKPGRSAQTVVDLDVLEVVLGPETEQVTVSFVVGVGCAPPPDLPTDAERLVCLEPTDTGWRVTDGTYGAHPATPWTEAAREWCAIDALPADQRPAARTAWRVNLACHAETRFDGVARLDANALTPQQRDQLVDAFLAAESLYDLGGLALTERVLELGDPRVIARLRQELELLAQDLSTPWIRAERIMRQLSATLEWDKGRALTDELSQAVQECNGCRRQIWRFLNALEDRD